MTIWESGLLIDTAEQYGTVQGTGMLELLLQ